MLAGTMQSGKFAVYREGHMLALCCMQRGCYLPLINMVRKRKLQFMSSLLKSSNEVIKYVVSSLHVHDIVIFQFNQEYRIVLRC